MYHVLQFFELCCVVSSGVVAGGEMKIACILPVYWPAIGGCELHTHELVRRLSEKHDVEVITLVSRQEDKYKGGDFWLACVLSAPLLPEVYHDHKASVKKIALKLLEKRFAALLLRIQRSSKVSRLVREYASDLFINFYRKKLLAIIGDCDIVHSIHGDVSWLGYAALKAAREKGVPFVYTAVSHIYRRETVLENQYQGAGSVDVSGLPMDTRGSVNEIWLKTCYKADVLLAMTEFERDFFIKNNINKNTYTTGVGPIISEQPAMDFKEKHGIKDNRVILFLGRINRDKGIEEILGAARLVWEKFPDTYFFFMGPTEWGIEELFEQYRDHRIVITGAVDIDEKSAALKACDVLCVPSVTESLGGVYLEAWFFGKPIIGADIPPVREITGNGKGGVLVKPSPEGIANGILSLLEDPRIGTEMGEWGRQRVLKKYNWQDISVKVEEIYLKLLSETGKTSA